MPKHPELWTAQNNGSFMYCPAAMQIGGWVRPEGDRWRATTHNYYEGISNPPPELSEVFDKADDALNWLEDRWAAARRQAGLEDK
jgi:hypothetical protein